MIATKILETGPVKVTDFRCDAGPHSRPFPEQHHAFSIAYVRAGSFSYACQGHRWELVPGSILVGHPGDEYVCTHEHVCGDECLSFSMTPELVEDLQGLQTWRSQALPPLPEIVVLGELAEAAARHWLDVAVDEAGMMLASQVATIAGSSSARDGTIPPVDRRRAIEAACWIESNAHESIDLGRIAEQAGLSRYHFLRVFKRVLGVTPHQHLIRARVRRASRLLVLGDLPVTDVAFEAGFGDLSNFVRTFSRAAGVSPGAFRKRALRDRNFRQEWLKRRA
jgi:AraC family transcriptional regulator